MVSPNGSSPAGRCDDAVCASPSLHWSAGSGWSHVSETLVVEAALAIEIAYERAGHEVRKVLAVTMRTPGNDHELALGFLFAEGLIRGLADVAASSTAMRNARGEAVLTQRVRLVRAPREDLQRLSRGLVTSSACGLCGRPSLEGLPMPAVPPCGVEPPLDASLATTLPDLLRSHQRIFASTGGSHGAALCDRDGKLHLAREDVGRHNAVDKLIGAALHRRMSFADKILVLSGRASFELIQKSAAAGIPIVVAVGAPSSLAVTLAQTAGISLIGFCREGRCNVYAHAERIAMSRPAAEAAPVRVDRDLDSSPPV